MSSDALLMNIFCYPGVIKRREVSLLLGTGTEEIPQFGFMPRVPLVTGAMERTEVDMKLGDLLFEAKLTEGDFQVQDARIVHQYRDLREVLSAGNCRGKASIMSRINSCGTCSRPTLLISAFASCSMPAGETCSNSGTGSCDAYGPQPFALDARYSPGRNWRLAYHRHYASFCP
jgi:hypothetical protein